MRSIHEHFPVFALVAVVFAIVVTSPAVAQQSAPREVDTTQTSAVSGLVYDSVAMAPLAGAIVQLVEATRRQRSYTATSDSAGRFEMPQVRAGQYVAGFFHPSLDALGLEPPLKLVTVGAAPAAIELETPPPARVAAALCGAHLAADSTGAMVGMVRNANTGLPVPGAKVIVSWTDALIDRGLHVEHKRVPAQTREDGSYTICGLPGDDQVIGSAESPGRETGLIEIHTLSGSLVRRDFSLGDSTANTPASGSARRIARSAGDAAGHLLRGSARVAGTVRGADSYPVAGAKVMVWGTGLTSVTDHNGAFSIEGLPAGTFSLEARMLGYLPVRAAVDLASNKTASVALAFGDPATALAPVTVMGKRTNAARDLNGFLQRKQAGFGHYVTAEEIERHSDLSVTDALRTTPGLLVRPGRFGYAVSARGGCSPEVYIDGVLLYEGASNIDEFVQPNDVAGIEVYTGVASAPPQYLANACGVILVWTKH